jgi:hypothetical protein
MGYGSKLVPKEALKEDLGRPAPGQGHERPMPFWSWAMFLGQAIYVPGKSTRRSGAKRGGSAGGYLPGLRPRFLIRRLSPNCLRGRLLSP